MESPNPESSTLGGGGAKRKRTPIPETAPTPAIHSSSNVTQINYLSKASNERLSLIEGDAETFGDVLGMLDDYEGVLQRHESLAANLGAKLVGPLLLKSLEKLFDGPIKVIQTSFALEQSPISWLDIVTFARGSPKDFVLSNSVPGVKSSRFWIKGGQVEISEDDYRLIMSGGPERMIPIQPIAEDESAELGTLNILEARLAMLIRRADAVASKARQLNYHLKGRKTAILSRKAAEQPTVEPSERTFSPQPFSAINTRSSAPEVAKIQQQLLDQFLTTPSITARRTSIAHSRPKASTRLPPSSSSNNIETPPPSTNFHTFNGSITQDSTDRRMSHPHPSSSSEDGTGDGGQHRILMAGKIEKLAKGDPIFPPCDRCRRLRFECTKHLTACSACTKKHAKCGWKDVKDGELEFVPLQSPVQEGGPDNGSGVDGVPFGGGENLQGIVNVGPRNGLPGFQVEALGVEQRDRERGVSGEHAMLSHIASAAAATGNR